MGYGRNRSIERSSGNYFCFQDIDDEMFPDRIQNQLDLAVKNKNSVISLLKILIDMCMFTFS